MDNLFIEVEERAIKHIEEIIDDKQLMIHFKNTATAPIRMYVKAMLEEYHNTLMEKLNIKV